MYLTGSLIVCLRDKLVLQFSGEKEKREKGEIMWLGLVFSFVD